ncbi:MAG: 4Fe-4S ferredoxin iron-sulfur binding domain-containing protein [Promethearchaeota archaeon CR_4]|nr:MAG: 4Fe-4S ferredoxin iron-sulfur binding domain-containing protein [Candidatus Lokiarchaeota archaeon CR_4]
MTQPDCYERLRHKLNLFFINTPKAPSILKILAHLFTPEEAELLSLFNAPYLDARTVDTFAKRAKKDIGQVREIFDTLCKRGILFKYFNKNEDTDYYSLMAMLPGLFEFYYSANPSLNLEEEARPAEWFEDYKVNIFQEEARSTFPWVRVLPAAAPVDKLIEVNQAVSSDPEILPFEIAKEVLDQCRRIAVIPCACRVHGRYLGRDVSKWPIETCLMLNSWADFAISQGFGREFSKDEAEQLLHTCSKAGLVHSTMNSMQTYFICNCDPENCLILAGFIRRRYNDTLTRSNFIPAFDHTLCKKCGTCIEKCPTNALSRHYPHASNLEDDFVTWREELCIGCGVCATNCTQGAINLQKVRDSKVKDSLVELWQSFAAGKCGLHNKPQ